MSRAADGNGHVPVQRRRGLDGAPAPAARALHRGARGSPPAASQRLRRARRTRGRHGGRLVLRRLRATRPPRWRRRRSAQQALAAHEWPEGAERARADGHPHRSGVGLGRALRRSRRPPRGPHLRRRRRRPGARLAGRRARSCTTTIRRRRAGAQRPRRADAEGLRPTDPDLRARSRRTARRRSRASAS